MNHFELFLLDLYRMQMITNRGRYDAWVSAFDDNAHLLSCRGSYLVPGDRRGCENKILIEATVMCGHDETAMLEFELNNDLWILKEAA